MSADVDTLLSSLQSSDPFKPSRGGLVQSQDGTIREIPGTRPIEERFTEEEETNLDNLFRGTKSYWVYKKEKPIHRLILWATINGQKPAEIATQLRITVQAVRNTQGQDWFQEAFCKITTERGKDALDTYLQTQALPSLERLVKLAESSDSDAVKLAANREILDRIRGKPTVHVKSESSGTLDVVVHDAAALQAEFQRNQEILRSRGIGTGKN